MQWEFLGTYDRKGGPVMESEKLPEALHTAEKLKDTTRHCYTSGGRHESVAEHSWRTALMAYWISDEFPEADMNKVIKMLSLYKEMEERQTIEAKIYKAMDSLEAVISHNESDIKTWAPNEYELNQVYGNDKVTFSEYLLKLRECIRRETLEKMEKQQ